MNKYRFNWRDGSVSEGHGTTPEEAFTHLGYGAGAARALDYWERISESSELSPSTSSPAPAKE